MSIDTITYTDLVTATTADVDDVNTPMGVVYDKINEIIAQTNTNTSGISDLGSATSGPNAQWWLRLANGSGDADHELAISASYLGLRDASTVAWDTNLTNPGTTIDIEDSGANGLDVGTVAANTNYNIYGIYNPTTEDFAGLASLQSVGPTRPSGYTKFRRLGMIRTDSSANILPFYSAIGSPWYYLYTPLTVETIAAGTAATNIEVPIPGGINSRALLYFKSTDTTNTTEGSSAIWSIQHSQTVTTSVPVVSFTVGAASQATYYAANIAFQTFSGGSARVTWSSPQGAGWSGDMTVYQIGWSDDATY